MHRTFWAQGRGQADPWGPRLQPTLLTGFFNGEKFFLAIQFNLWIFSFMASFCGESCLQIVFHLKFIHTRSHYSWKLKENASHIFSLISWLWLKCWNKAYRWQNAMSVPLTAVSVHSKHSCNFTSRHPASAERCAMEIHVCLCLTVFWHKHFLTLISSYIF